jgi:DNA polymerase I-like protein with 3'-5' exonuclease and polymerase domains
VNLFEDKDNYVFHPSYTNIQTNAEMEKNLDKILSLKHIALDTETNGLDPRLNQVLMVQISDEDHAFLIDARSVDIVRYLKRYLEDPTVLKVGHNISFDYGMLLMQKGIRINNLYCTMVAEQIISAGRRPGERFRLSDVCFKRLYIKLDKDAVITFLNHTGPFTSTQLHYGARDVLILPEIRNQQLRYIKKYGLENIVEEEMRIIGPLTDVELQGCCIDYDKWNLILDNSKHLQLLASDELKSLMADFVAQRTLFGTPSINLNSQSQLLTVFERMGILLEDTASKTLEEEAGAHEVIRLLLEYRMYEKIRSAYGNKLLGKKHKITSRIHPRYNQAHAATGRMSVRNPNHQQVPRPKSFERKLFKLKDEDLEYQKAFLLKERFYDEGNNLPRVPRSDTEVDSKDKYYHIGNIDGIKKIYIDSEGFIYKYIPDFRECFIAPSGKKIIQCDFVQAELKILAAVSQDPKMLRVYQEGGDIHSATSIEIFGDASPENRFRSKSINFGNVYGQTAYGLSRLLNIPEAEAQQILTKFRSKYPVSTRWLRNTGVQAFADGFSDTRLGRRRWLPFTIDPNKFPEEAERLERRLMRRGVNHKIQGGNADVTKRALCYLDNAFRLENLDARIIIIIHDEFVIECSEDHAERAARVTEREMSRAFEEIYPEVPMSVEAQIGAYWLK